MNIQSPVNMSRLYNNIYATRHKVVFFLDSVDIIRNNVHDNVIVSNAKTFHNNNNNMHSVPVERRVRVVVFIQNAYTRRDHCANATAVGALSGQPTVGVSNIHKTL